MRRWLFIVLVGPLWANDESAVALLEKVAATYKSISTYYFVSESENTLTGEWQRSVVKGRSTLAYEAPDRVRFEIVDQIGSYVVVSDGKKVLRASGNTREYSRTPVKGSVFSLKGGGREAEIALSRLKSIQEQYWKINDGVLKAYVLRTEDWEIGDKRIPCTVVQAEYKVPPQADGVEVLTRRFWIDTRRNVLLQYESVTSGHLFPDKPFEHVESHRKTWFTMISVNEPIADSLFTYTPPGNFREVSTLEGTALRNAQSLTGKAAPEVEARTLDNNPFLLKTFRGRVVLLSFWATWCAPCHYLMPFIAKLHSLAIDQDLTIIGVNDDETPDLATTYLRARHYEWLNVFDGKQLAVRKNFKVQTIPTLILIDKNGKITEYQVGAGAETERAIVSALQRCGIRVPDGYITQ